ncbi:hypothetical protein [Gemmobacter denitrificans]|uniref:Uncharacterized protein n=1 Tax=Gemmobacter denitrificans TaxID=3123040 RepID=A0ABU8BQ20_9RHOB
MDLQRLFQMLFNRVVSRMIGRAMKLGIDRMVGPKPDRKTMTPAERTQADQAAAMTRRAKQATKFIRRL